jgi:hypothetical protein
MQGRESMSLTADYLKTFIDWLTADSIHYLTGRFGRAPANQFLTDYTGVLRYYGPHWGFRGLISADFLGIFAADDGSGSQVIVALSATDPVGMAVQFVGGQFDGLSVDAKTVQFDGDTIGNPDMIIYFIQDSYEYNLQIIKQSLVDPRIHKLPV